jgi:hypothetical protein
VLISGHASCQPLFGATNAFWDIWASQVLLETAATAQGLRAGEKPGLEFPMGQDDPYRNVGPHMDGTLEQGGAELRRTVVVAVEEDQDAAIPAGTACRELHDALELSFLEKLVSSHPERMDLNGGFGSQGLGDSSHQDRNRFEVALTLDDTRQLELHQEIERSKRSTVCPAGGAGVN